MFRNRCFLALCLLALSACDAGRDGSDLGVVAPPSLRLELRGDNGGGSGGSASGLQEAIAVVHAAAAHVAGSGWHTIMEGHVEVDFLRLADHAADLGIANIPAGKVTQIRLYVLDDEEAYVTDAQGDRHPLITPSGSESGIKVKGLWSIGACEAGTLVLSTNGKKAIHIHGRGADDSYILRPVIRANRFDATPIDGCVPGGDDGDGDDGDGDDGDGDDGDGDDGDGDDGDGDDGDGDDGDGDDGDEGGCFNPEGGTCEGGAGDDNGFAGEDDQSGDGTGTGSGDGDTGSGGTGDGTDTGSGTDGTGGSGDGSDTGSGTGATGDTGGTGDGTDTGSGTGDTGTGGTDGTGTGDGTDTGSGSGGTGTGGTDGTDGSGDESELCYDPEGGGFYDC